MCESAGEDLDHLLCIVISISTRLWGEIVKLAWFVIDDARIVIEDYSAGPSFFIRYLAGPLEEEEKTKSVGRCSTSPDAKPLEGEKNIVFKG